MSRSGAMAGGGGLNSSELTGRNDVVRFVCRKEKIEVCVSAQVHVGVRCRVRFRVDKLVT